MPKRVSPRPVAAAIVLAVAVGLLDSAGAAVPSPAIAPERPRQHVDTTLVAPSGQTIVVPAGGNFQAALNAAQPGDVITLQAGATFTGPFTLPNKPGAGWITVRTSAPDSALPPPGTRIDPSHAPLLPKLVVSREFDGAIQTASGAHHFRFIGIEFRPTAGAVIRSLVRLGNGESDASLLPHDLIVDRCYIHGDPAVGGYRGIEMNSTWTAVIDSYISGFKNITWDTHAIWIWNGPGPFKIANNYLEGAGENILFGGQDPAISNLVTADVEIRGNHFAKPLSWRVGDPTYAGTSWMVKNLFELKNARRVLVDGNVFEYNWPKKPGGQDGLAILFTPRNQSGRAPWATVEDVTFTHNVVRHSQGGVLIFGTDPTNSSQQTRRILIQNNLFYDIGAFPEMPNDYFPPGVLLVMGNGSPVDVIVDHNTAFQTMDPVVNNTYPVAPVNFVFTNNLTLNGAHGVPSVPGAVVDRNVIIGGTPLSRVSGNLFPSTPAQVGFVNYAGGDYHLALASPYKHAGTDGKDIGADIDALHAAVPSWPRTMPRP